MTELRGVHGGAVPESVLAGRGVSAPLAAVREWLLREGRYITEPDRLVEALAQRLLDAGLPLWRLRLGFRTLHPQVAAISYTWIRGRHATETRVLHGIEQTEAYLGSPIQIVYETSAPVRYRLDQLDPERDHPVLHELAAQGAIDYLALPFVFSTGQTSALIAVSDRPSGFAEEHVRELEALTDYLAPLLEVISTRRIAAALLDTYVGHRTGGKVLAGLIKRGDGERIEAALWFSDLRDSTLHSESLSPERMLAMLNAYFEFVAAAVTARGGEILRFIGDAMLIVFPVGANIDMQNACNAALDSALDAFASLGPLNHRRRRAGEPAIRFGVGLHCGEVTYGNVGAPDRLDFTVMGPAVNRTARIEGLTKTLGVPLLCSEEFARHLHRPVRSLGRHPMKGIRGEHEVFALPESDRPAEPPARG